MGGAAQDRAVAAYRAEHGREPTLVVRAPGRVNLIGEHTDYNDGFVLPMALPFAIVIAGEPRPDRRVVAASEGFEPTEFELDESAPSAAPGWASYVHGVGRMLIDEGHAVGGWQASIASDIPSGASLSSSAALEVASGLMSVTAAGGSIDMAALARIGQRVENEVLGLPSGIMDQLASATCEEGTASLIDCRDLTQTSAPLPAGCDVVIMDTGTRRELVDSEYAARRLDCEAAAAALGVAALRDATLDQLADIDNERVHRRARHVITENERTLAAARAMDRDDPDELGRLMSESHTSLRDDYDVSGPALDAIVELAQATVGCYGARMTGGGFAGCAVALVAQAKTESFLSLIEVGFVSPATQPATEPTRLHAVTPAAGASVVTAP